MNFLSTNKPLNRDQIWLRTFKLATSVANDTFGPTEAFRLALESICASSRFPIGHVYEILSTDPFRFKSLKSWQLEMPDKFKRFRQLSEGLRDEPEAGLLNSICRSGKPAWITQIADEFHFYRREEATRLGIKSAVFVPVRIQAEVVGILELYSDEVRPADPYIFENLQYLGIVLGRIIERRRTSRIS